MGPVFFFPAALAVPLVVCAQSQASLGAAVGVVRHGGGSSFSALTISPAAQLLSPSLFLGAGGGVSILEAGVWAGQGRADLWAAYPRRPSGTRFALSASVAGSTRSDGIAAGAGSLLAEAVWSGTTAKGPGGIAAGAGAVAGAIEGFSGVGAARLRARAWWQPTTVPAQLTLSIESTRFQGAWYSDLVASAALEQARLAASLWVSARVSGTYGSTGAASAALQYFVTPSLSLELAGGNYLRDPFQGLPQAGFLTGGLRIYAGRRVAPPDPVRARAPELRPLVAQHRGGDTVVVRFRMSGAQTVAIAGDWNGWTPEALRGLGEDIWEGALLLRPGTYHFNLVVDGAEWVVPGGVATASDGMGGLVAILTVL